MSETRVTVADGKYMVIHENGLNFRALRYGEMWRDLTGDGLVLALTDALAGVKPAPPVYDQAFHDETRRIAAELPGKLAPLMEAVVHAQAIADRRHLEQISAPESHALCRWLTKARACCSTLLDVTRPSKLSEYETFVTHIASGSWDYTITAKARALLGQQETSTKEPS